ncbi:MAG: SPOR domain-containing protein [Alphaproteobacteria bacterium]|nr:SPOR domain-containing protein [Alphaproteobacteria bacterium]
MTGGTLRRGAKLGISGVAIAIAIPLLAQALQNPGAQWRRTVHLVDEIAVLTPPAQTVKAGWAVQVGAYGDAETAGARLAQMAAGQADLLASATAIVEPVDLPGGKRLYRARFGTFNRQDADGLCAGLRARGLTCVIMAQAPVSIAPAPEAAVAQAPIPEAPAPDAPPVPPVVPVQVAKADRIQALDDGALAGMRGGFFLAGGAQFDFGASVRTMVNGQLALQSNVQWTQGGAVVQQVVGPNAAPIAPAQLAQLFGGSDGAQMGVTVPAPSGSTAVLTNLASGQVQNVLLNTASNQTVSQNTDVLLTIYNLPQLQQQVGQQLLAVRLANEIAAANIAAH